MGVYTRREAEGRREATDGEGDRMGSRTRSSGWSSFRRGAGGRGQVRELNQYGGC